MAVFRKMKAKKYALNKVQTYRYKRGTNILGN